MGSKWYRNWQFCQKRSKILFPMNSWSSNSLWMIVIGNTKLINIWFPYHNLKKKVLIKKIQNMLYFGKLLFPKPKARFETLAKTQMIHWFMTYNTSNDETHFSNTWKNPKLVFVIAGWSLFIFHENGLISQNWIWKLNSEILVVFHTLLFFWLRAYGSYELSNHFPKASVRSKGVS